MSKNKVGYVEQIDDPEEEEQNNKDVPVEESDTEGQIKDKFKNEQLVSQIYSELVGKESESEEKEEELKFQDYLVSVKTSEEYVKPLEHKKNFKILSIIAL